MDDEILDALWAIDPASCDYNEWLTVGMALESEGYDYHVWDEWSKQDSQRYNPGECERKFESFGSYGEGSVTGATIYHLAREAGWEPEVSGDVFDFDRPVSLTGEDNSTDTAITLPVETTATPSEQIAQYINAVFEPDDRVNIVIRTYVDDEGNNAGPDRGMYLNARDVVGRMELIDTDPAVGAWVCVNPLDDSGHRKNSAVTNCRVGVFESDTDDPDEFRRVTRELGLPVVAEVDSGNKSIHELVRLDAADLKEFRKRWELVADLYAERGMTVDPKCKNAARLTRLPGVQRGERFQTLLATNFGASSWREFANANEKPLLPDWDDADISEEIPDDPELVEGILRYGETALITARAKRGKTWLVLQLAVSIALGRPFLGHQTKEGRVLFIDPELKRKTARKRLQKIARAMKAPEDVVGERIKIWSLRGRLTREGKVPDVQALAHDLELKGQHFDLVIIDSVSAFLGEDADENDNASIRRFITGHVARIAKAAGGAVIMIHHEGKGATGDRTSEDRARGAGAWVDCPDVVMGLTAIYPPQGAPEEFLPPGGHARRLECVAIRDNPEFEAIDVVHVAPMYYTSDKLHIDMSDWRVQTSASLGGKAAGAIAKAKAADRAEECCRILLNAHGREWRGIISASDAADLVSRALGETVKVSTLKKYIDSSQSLGVIQTSPKRWSIENLTN